MPQVSIVAVTAAALLGCAAEPTDEHGAAASLSGLQMSAPVDWALIEPVVAELEQCLGRRLNLDGWAVRIVEDARPSCSGPLAFDCPIEPETCGEPPWNAAEARRYTESECPCLCSGVTSATTRTIAVAPSLHDRSLPGPALRHELIHAGTGIGITIWDPHHERAEWECQ